VLVKSFLSLTSSLAFIFVVLDLLIVSRYTLVLSSQKSPIYLECLLFDGNFDLLILVFASQNQYICLSWH
jgi:hypothetical protein